MVAIKEAVVVTVVLALVFIMEPLAQLGTVAAQYPFSNLTLAINSPQPGEVYQTTSIPIVVIVMPFETGKRFVDIYYSLDDGPNIQLSITTYQETTSIYGRGTLDNLTNGYHTVKAYATDTQGNTLSGFSTRFLVNTSSTTPLPTATQPVPEFPATGAAFLVIVVFAFAVAYGKKYNPEFR